MKRMLRREREGEEVTKSRMKRKGEDVTKMSYDEVEKSIKKRREGFIVMFTNLFLQIIAE